eukprot:CAMPEP_0173377840 /NCGR_PEP_ID=MMETSP1356-20130122/1133_1 /TAXON_ID=77927 ORGANISM="Hemiselmis virescens, Strain PCC157" /NCGR_SAMPLE_ID=MMETSP1356 /ASSEMBLY_ACC=CAM_ASM_000847 /LENGTH=108 /DNA_ID=CAMNT_0014330739 /DNA_START=138 /DNA_END=465 /DNA_ORIENTATION=-
MSGGKLVAGNSLQLRGLSLEAELRNLGLGRSSVPPVCMTEPQLGEGGGETLPERKVLAKLLAKLLVLPLQQPSRANTSLGEGGRAVPSGGDRPRTHPPGHTASSESSA